MSAAGPLRGVFHVAPQGDPVALQLVVGIEELHKVAVAAARAQELERKVCGLLRDLGNLGGVRLSPANSLLQVAPGLVGSHGDVVYPGLQQRIIPLQLGAIDLHMYKI